MARGNMDRKAKAYISYLLRLYRVREGGVWTWRVFLEDPLSGQCHRFPDLESLYTFLKTETRRASGEPDEGTGEDR